MNAKERKALLRRIDDDVMRIQHRLDECHAQILAIQERFKAERGQILNEIRRQTNRGQQTNLILKVMRRERRVLAVPVAEWRTIKAKGNRVARAQQTLGQGVAKYTARGHMAIFSNTLPMNRKCGWRITDLRTHAHPAEIELVSETEALLLPIRKRIADLTNTGKRLLQRRHQHQRRLETEPAVAPKCPPRQRKTPAWPSMGNPFPLAPEPTQAEGLFERPQLRNPYG
ncbi:hypothetical protein [Rhodanobacter aciditrophus]|uniref:hypothetical protein n=1 Tax=Rhodanobacter aciditrophus TaxID=1623218 RepID=UPI003CEC3B00